MKNKKNGPNFYIIITSILFISTNVYADDVQQLSYSITNNTYGTLYYQLGNCNCITIHGATPNDPPPQYITTKWGANTLTYTAVLPDNNKNCENTGSVNCVFRLGLDNENYCEISMSGHNLKTQSVKASGKYYTCSQSGNDPNSAVDIEEPYKSKK